jgi:hypothetical protein
MEDVYAHSEARGLGGRRWLVWGAVLWASLLVAGIACIARYNGAAEAQGAAPDQWPGESRLARVTGKSTLVMFVHPKCSCSRASLSELDAIMTLERDPVSAVVVFLQPAGVPDDWSLTDTWDTAGRIPNTVRLLDRSGDEATRFGARTSGQVVLYGPDGHLRFAGGITASRGHAGDNVGRQTVLEVLGTAPDSPRARAVFGCALSDSKPAATTKGETP